MNTHIYIRSLFTLLVLLTLVSCRPKCSTPPAISECFERLVTALDSSESYHQIQEKKLIDYKRKAASAGSDEARFYHYKLITELYYEFDVDSTEYYVQKNLEIARRNGKPQWEADCYLQAAHLYNCIGFFEQGRKALDALSSLDMTFDQRLQYYLETIDYWNTRAIFLNTPNPDPTGQAYADSVLELGSRVPTPLQVHARVWKETDNERKAALVEDLKRTVDQMSPEDPWYARLCGEAGLLSLYVNGSEQDEMEYLTRYVVSSLRNVSRATPLLFYVEQIALKYGELDIANRLLSALVRMQQDYPDRIRQPLYPFMTELNDVTRSRLEQESRRNFTLLLVATVSFVVMALLFVFAFYNLRRRIKLQSLLKEKNQLLTENSKRLKDEQSRLRDANEALRQASDELKEESSRLSEANYLKEEYIGQMFATCSEYLQKIEAVKRDINRKLTARQYDLALKATRPKSEDDMKEQHELWAKFDEVFLQLFPDFVEQFNSLLRPEERISLRPGEKLNTDLRIYAMVRLGINSSTKIAKILGLSTQSVYNARQKMRARATESEEEFAVRVRRLAISSSLIEGDREMK
jgi:hypothetical protein